MQTLPETAPTCNLIARYATFHDEPGYAIRTSDRRVLFVDHDAQTVELTPADASHLVLLGDVNLAERQHLLDTLHSGAARIACARLQEVAS